MYLFLWFNIIKIVKVCLFYTAEHSVITEMYLNTTSLIEKLIP